MVDLQTLVIVDANDAKHWYLPGLPALQATSRLVSARSTTSSALVIAILPGIVRIDPSTCGSAALPSTEVLQHHNRSRQKGHESEGTNALIHISIHVTRWLSLAETQDTKANPGPEGWELCAEQLYQKHNSNTTATRIMCLIKLP